MAQDMAFASTAQTMHANPMLPVLSSSQQLKTVSVSQHTVNVGRIIVGLDISYRKAVAWYFRRLLCSQSICNTYRGSSCADGCVCRATIPNDHWPHHCSCVPTARTVYCCVFSQVCKLDELLLLLLLLFCLLT